MNALEKSILIKSREMIKFEQHQNGHSDKDLRKAESPLTGSASRLLVDICKCRSTVLTRFIGDQSGIQLMGMRRLTSALN
jgi:hypothetical protein